MLSHLSYASKSRSIVTGERQPVDTTSLMFGLRENPRVIKESNPVYAWFWRPAASLRHNPSSHLSSVKKFRKHLVENLPQSDKIFRNWGEVIRTVGTLFAVLFTFVTMIVTIVHYW